MIKPKVVRTEAIGTKPAAAPAGGGGKFEPVRSTPAQPQYPPAQQGASARSNTPTAGHKTDRLKHDKPKAVPDQAAASAAYEPAAVPLPRTRPEMVEQPQPKPAKPAVRAEKRRAPAEKESSKLATVDPTAVVSFIKNLVTPDEKKKPRKRRGTAAAAEAPPPSLPQ
jgi:hypothetical protein